MFDYDKHQDPLEAYRDPIYCKHCGKKLIKDDSVLGYDEYTGKPIRPLFPKKVCPHSLCRLYNAGKTTRENT